MEATINPKRQYQTRDGRQVRIYAVDGGGERPVHGALKDGRIWCLHNWYSDGRALSPSLDLIPVPERHTLWVNVYRDEGGLFSTSHKTRETADKYVTNGEGVYIARLRIEFEEGQFDE